MLQRVRDERKKLFQNTPGASPERKLIRSAVNVQETEKGPRLLKERGAKVVTGESGQGHTSARTC